MENKNKIINNPVISNRNKAGLLTLVTLSSILTGIISMRIKLRDDTLVNSTEEIIETFLEDENKEKIYLSYINMLKNEYIQDKTEEELNNNILIYLFNYFEETGSSILELSDDEIINNFKIYLDSNNYDPRMGYTIFNTKDIDYNLVEETSKLIEENYPNLKEYASKYNVSYNILKSILIYSILNENTDNKINIDSEWLEIFKKSSHSISSYENGILSTVYIEELLNNRSINNHELSAIILASTFKQANNKNNLAEILYMFRNPSLLDEQKNISSNNINENDFINYVLTYATYLSNKEYSLLDSQTSLKPSSFDFGYTNFANEINTYTIQVLDKNGILLINNIESLASYYEDNNISTIKR